MYLLDTNVLIEAKNRYYGFDLCPGFWEWLDAAHGSGRVFSIEKVADELEGGADELTVWAQARGDAFFLPLDADVVQSMRTVTQWAIGAGYPQAAVSTFLQAADYYLVAHAHAQGHTVVTHETPGATKRIKLPDACASLGVRFTNPFTMLRAEGARFRAANGSMTPRRACRTAVRGGR